MKAVKVLLIILLVMILLMCGVIILYFFNPELFDRFKKEDPAPVAEIEPAEPTEEETEPSEEPVTEETVSEDEAPTEEPSEEDPYFAEDLPGAGLASGLDESYDPGSVSMNDVPKELKDMTGLADMRARYDILDKDKADELSSLSTGPLGDDLEFDPEYYPYYHMLDDPGQRLYRQIYANAKELNPHFRSCITVIPWASLKNVFEAVFNDNPDLFWMNTEFSAGYRDNGDCLEIILSFNPTSQDLEQAAGRFDEGANEIGSTAAGDDYDCEKAVHDAILDNFTYSLSAEMNQSAYSGFANKSTVCAGYARCFQYEMQMLGIPCYYCRGVAGEPHAWNIIKLDGEYYNVDATWDDSTNTWQYEYFNLSDDDIRKDHRRAGLSVYLPACTGSRYSGLEQRPADDSNDSPDSASSGNDRGSDAGSSGDGDSGEDRKHIDLPEGKYVSSLEEYYQYCSDTIKEKGKGNYTFDVYTTDKNVYNSCMQAYSNGSAKSGYMNGAFEATDNAKGMSVDFIGSDEDGVYKMTQKVRLW